MKNEINNNNNNNSNSSSVKTNDSVSNHDQQDDIEEPLNSTYIPASHHYHHKQQHHHINHHQCINNNNNNNEDKEKRTRSRKWSDEEVDLFLNILSDTRYMFAASLENLVPKKRSNYEIFMNARKVYQRELREKHRQRVPGFEYSLSLDLSLEKLRKKYSNLKVEWRKMSEKQMRAAPGTVCAEPRWYRSVEKLMSDIKKASEDVNLSTVDPCADSFSDDFCSGGDGDVATMASDEDFSSPYRSLTDERQRNNHTNKQELFDDNDDKSPLQPLSGNSPPPHTTTTTKNNSERETSRVSPNSQEHPSTREHETEPRYVSTRSFGKRPMDHCEQFPYTRLSNPRKERYIYYETEYKRPKIMQGHTEFNNAVGNSSSVTEVAEGLKQLAELQLKRQKLIIEAEYKNYDLYLRHKEQEAERNRVHELQLADVYSKALTGVIHNLPRQTPPPVGSVVNNHRERAHSPLVTRSLAELENEIVTPTYALSYNNNNHRGDPH